MSSQPDVAMWIDASAGVAGDMLLGALLDAGADLERVRAQVGAVAPGELTVDVAPTRRAGLRAAKAGVTPLVEDSDPRTWSAVRQLLVAADLAPDVRERATAVFARLAQVEAAVHDIDAADVHFHEVGALDAIGDIVGVCAAVHDLRVGSITVSAIALGSGTVETAHGSLPLPGPAVLELSRGWPVMTGGDGELATPTGVALVTTLADAAGPLPDMTVQCVGVGAGTRERDGRANVVRVVLGTPTSTPAALDVEVVIEANVDDLDPRAWPAVLAALLDAGARDAWLTPILMKKGRPGHTLHVLAAQASADMLRDLVVEQTSAIGTRSHDVGKHALARTWASVDVGGRPVRVKIAHSGGRIVQVSAEYDDAAALAAQLGRPVAHVLADAGRAAEAAGLLPGEPVP
ncbi:nickel pincer cofactor biosynthesis protein LarC [uncultured Jatrophihabitans sp.]|uniref:nickel pincer cofactor biosynthesis protein LarC n=1 Tax=uncultured Jatrophihabitans sp. TaxID=1610747 RepID=UPI0035CAB570